ncbi:MAG: hypothetical protein QW228_01415 [Candidatus Aenigmatarchaeota archaeon]
MAVKVPFAKFLIGSVVYANTYDSFQEFLITYDVPLITEDQYLKLRSSLFGSKSPKTRLDIRTKYKILVDKKCVEFADVFLKHKENEVFEDACELHKNVTVRLIIELCIMFNELDKLAKYIGYDIDKNVLSMFIYYFFNTNNFTWRDWYYYVKLLNHSNPHAARVIQKALEKNKSEAFWLLGKIYPKTKEEIVDSLTTVQYYTFMRCIEDGNLRDAVRLSRSCLEALKLREEKVTEEEFLEIKQIPKEYLITISPKKE